MRKHPVLWIPLAVMVMGYAPAQVVISEIRTGGPGQDVNDYFELRVTTGASLAGLTYVVLSFGAGGGEGVVHHAIPLDPVSPADPYFLVADSAFNLGAADMVVPLGFDEGLNSTHLLVSGFSGLLWQDLDTDDDGTLDVLPWATIVDSLSFFGYTPGLGLVYSPNFPSAALAPQYPPPNAARCAWGWEALHSPEFVSDTPGIANGCGPETQWECDPANPNSTGNAAELRVGVGAPSSGLIHLSVTSGPPTEFGFFLVGTGLEANNPIGIGDGWLCLALGPGDLVARYNQTGTTRNSVGRFDANGELVNLVGTAASSFGFDVPNQLPFSGSPMIQSGQSYHFQVWYRDGNAPGLSNLTNALTVHF